jgi:hypothetical protein
MASRPKRPLLELSDDDESSLFRKAHIILKKTVMRIRDPVLFTHWIQDEFSF